MEKIQMWVACVLTAGEWCLAILVLFHHGEVTMLYLAATYAIRETSGGRHYHEIIADCIHKIYFHRRG